MVLAALLVGLLTSTAVALPASEVQQASQAQSAYEAGNYTQARELWLPLANAGNAEAAFRLGLLDDLGEGTPEDTAAAYRWYLRAAEAGHAQAEFNVAVMRDSGRGTVRDMATAAAWYSRAAARGNHRAQYNLALLYSDGDGVPRNQAVARAWFRLAASGLPAAAQKLRAPEIEASPADQKDRTLRSAIPVTPPSGTAILSDADGAIEIVWSAPAQVAPVRYFLQVIVRGEGSQREIYAAYLDVTAVVVKLDRTEHAYAWRVFTVSPSSASYSVSSWTPFTT